MKRIFTFAVLTLIGFAVFTSCQKNETTTTYTMYADINGIPAYFGNCFVNISYNPAGASNYIIEAVPDSQNFPCVFMAVPEVAIGVYNFSSGSSAYYAKYFADSNTVDDATSGILVIASTTPYVTGTFSFTCTGGTTISKGIFTAKPVN